MQSKKIFISYSHENQEHMDWVRGLAKDLVENGVEVIVDQWHLRIGDDLPLFMEQSISQSDYVLLICTPTFAKKVNNRSGGTGDEGIRPTNPHCVDWISDRWINLSDFCTQSSYFEAVDNLIRRLKCLDFSIEQNWSNNINLLKEALSKN